MKYRSKNVEASELDKDLEKNLLKRKLQSVTGKSYIRMRNLLAISASRKDADENHLTISKCYILQRAFFK